MPWRHVSNSPICLASVEEREAGASSTYWAGYGSCVSPARSKPDLPLCQGSAAPLSPILDGSSGQPPLNGLLASLDVLMLFPEHMLVFWSTDRLPHLTSQSPAVLLLSGSLAGSSRPDFPILSLKPHRPQMIRATWQGLKLRSHSLIRCAACKWNMVVWRLSCVWSLACQCGAAEKRLSVREDLFCTWGISEQLTAWPVPSSRSSLAQCCAALSTPHQASVDRNTGKPCLFLALGILCLLPLAYSSSGGS